MDTADMVRLTELNSRQLFNLFVQSENLINIAVDFRQAMGISLIYNQVFEVMKQYNLGKVTEVYEIFGGYTNKSFGVYTEKDGKKYEYFVRKYKKGITEKEMELEHSLIDFSIANGLDIAAGLIRSNDGKTFVRFMEESNGEKEARYFAVYDFLSGEDKYTWDNPCLTDEEYVSSAEVLAIFHNASRDYDSRGRERVEPKILEFMPMLPKAFKEFAKRDLKNKCHLYYLRNIDEIIAHINRIKIPEEAVEKMIYNPVHADAHPGNFKYRDGQAVGIFDFDWAKIDLRLFDVCLALVYFCSSWEDLPDGSTDGTLRLDKCAIFLNAYQNKLKELAGLEPLITIEKEYFPVMIAAANIYLINWDLTTYYADTDNLNVYEYKTYLQHNVRLMKWVDQNQDKLVQLIGTV